MGLTLTGFFVLACVGMGIWMKKDNSFRKREFIAVSAFWILLTATPWGGDAVLKVHEILGTGVQTAANTVNSFSG